MSTVSQPQLDDPPPPQPPAAPVADDAAGRLLEALLAFAGLTRPAERETV
jgi:hypothetical protein